MTLSQDRLLEISKNVQEIRLKQRKTAEEMAEQVGITTAFYCQIESGCKSPSLETLINISEVLQVSIETLIRGEHSASRDNILHMLSDLSDEEAARLEIILRAIIENAF